MNRPGYFLLKHVKVLGASLHVHWSAVAVAGIMLGAWHRQPGLALEVVACYFGLILLHEIGHAAMAQRLGYRATDIRLSALHGLCTYDTPETLREDALVAWGGVLAQLAVAIPVLALGQVPAISSLPYAGVPLTFFGYYSVVLVVLNLAPIRGLDGDKAWKLLPILANDLRGQAAARGATKVVLARTSTAPKRDATPRRASIVDEGPSSARWLARACARLATADVTWPEIGNTLNPQHDRLVGELIQRVRASHMRAPLQGLQLIESACHVALEGNEDASGVDALTNAVDSLGTLEKARW